MKQFTIVVGLLFTTALISIAQEIPRWKIDDFTRYVENADAPVVINFWATYCVPCIEELPYFHSITAKYADKGVKLLLVSLDFEELYPHRIRTLADKRGFTAPIVWLDEEKPDEFCPLVDEKWAGSMPATLFYNPQTGFRKFVEAQMKPEELEQTIRSMLLPKQ